MIESILIKNATLALEEGLREGDCYIKNGKIHSIEPSINHPAELTIDASHLLLIPGILDPHVHFRDPGHPHKEDLESGSMAAAAGGVTSFFDMPNTTPSTTTIERMEQKKAIAAKKSIVNYNFFMGATADNLYDCLNAENIAGIKIYVGSSTGSLHVDNTKILDTIFGSGKRLIAVHSEDQDIINRNLETYQNSKNVSDHANIRSSEAAIACTKKLVALAIKHKRRFHICHLTTKEEAEFLEDVIRKHHHITTEVSPQHLLLNAPEVYEKWGTFAQINPPIRTKKHRDALWSALLNKTIGMIATDHAPHTREEKQQPFGKAPSGMPGVELSLPLMLNQVNLGNVSLQQVLNWLCKTPYRYFNVPNKGMLKPNYDGDVVLVDLKKTKTISDSNLVTKAGWSCFSGESTTGWPLITIVNGQVVFREGDFFKDTKGQEVTVL